MKLTLKSFVLQSLLAPVCEAAALHACSTYQTHSHSDVFLRELISNSNDAIEKLRLTTLTDKSVYSGENPLNITIQAFKDEEGEGGRIVITGTSIVTFSSMSEF